jgi:hypothetical protein
MKTRPSTALFRVVTLAACFVIPTCATLPQKRGHQPWVISHTIPF